MRAKVVSRWPSKLGGSSGTTNFKMPPFLGAWLGVWAAAPPAASATASTTALATWASLPPSLPASVPASLPASLPHRAVMDVSPKAVRFSWALLVAACLKLPAISNAPSPPAAACEAPGGTHALAQDGRSAWAAMARRGRVRLAGRGGAGLPSQQWGRGVAHDCQSAKL